MRIVHVVADLDRAKGGPVTAILGLTRAQAAAGHGVRIATTDVGWRGEEAGVVVELFHSWDRAWRFSPAFSRGIAGALAHADVVHLHGLWDFPIVAAANAARRAGKPYVVTLHGMLNALTQPRRPWRKRGYLALAGDSILRDARLLHFTTESEKANARACGFAGESFVCPFGTELPALREAGGDPVVLFVGRLHPQKQLQLLIAAFAAASLDVPSARLVIAGLGDDDYARGLRAIAQAAGAGRITFAGGLDAAGLGDAYAQCALLVLPSVEESLGLAALEAMAAGRPVIVTRGVGLAQDIAAAAAGRVVDSDAVSLAAAIVDLLEHPDERRRMGANGRALVESRYAWDRVVRILDAQYESLAAARVATP